MTTVLAMLLFMAFTCYGQGIDACYQKNDGQLRILTHSKNCDKDHNKNCDKDHDKDCDKDGYTNKCKPSEIAITLQGGGQIPEVPQICAGTVCYDDNTSLACPRDDNNNIINIISSCATVSKMKDINGNDQTGKYKISFDPVFDQTPPVCVFYVQPDPAYVIIQLVQTDADPSFISTYTFAPADAMAPVDSRFNFVCTEP